jgi:hypothetical protein
VHSDSVHFDSFDGMVRWVTKVAWNEVQMEWRHQARVELGSVPEHPAGPDPGTLVEGRLEVDVVAQGFAVLSTAERDAITSVLNDERRHDGPEEASLKMRRHRARRHLAALVGRGARP